MTRRPATGMRVAILDPGTLVARDVRALLEERAFPAARAERFHTRPSDAGILTADDDEATYVAPLEPGSLEDCSVAFACGEPGHLREFLARRLASDPCQIIDLTGLREEDAAPNLLLTDDPTARAVADAAAALESLVPLAGLSVVVDRPASELGQRALEELMQQAVGLASFRSVPTEHLLTQLAFNFLHPADGATFDADLSEDVVRLLGLPIPVDVLSSRSGTFHGHHVRIVARFRGEPPAESMAQAALLADPARIVAADEEIPSLIGCAGRSEAVLLAVRGGRGSVRVALASDHLRSRAMAAVRLAEESVREGSVLPRA